MARSDATMAHRSAPPSNRRIDGSCDRARLDGWPVRPGCCRGQSGRRRGSGRAQTSGRGCSGWPRQVRCDQGPGRAGSPAMVSWHRQEGVTGCYEHAGAHLRIAHERPVRWHRVRLCGAGLRQQWARQWPGGRRRTSAVHEPSMPPAGCCRAPSAVRTRHIHRPAGRLGSGQDERPAVQPGGPGCRSRPQPAGQSRRTAGHHAHRPTIVRCVCGRDRDRGPGSACRRQRACAMQRPLLPTAPAAARATMQHPRPSSPASSD